MKGWNRPQSGYGQSGRARSLSVQAILAAVMLAGAVGYVVIPDSAADVQHKQVREEMRSTPRETKPACNIKGNISDSGERIYHVPGQQYYSATVITPRRGERWFCSESEARGAGWRKARV